MGLQFVCGILTAGIFDNGFFSFLYHFVSIVLWIITGVYMYYRKHPTIIERFLIGSGPLLLFLAPFIIPLFFI